MKRLLSYFILTCIPVIFFSCMEEIEQVYEEPKEEKIFYASVEKDDSLMTKTMVWQDPETGQYQLHWLKDDCIGISNGNNNVEKFVNISTENGKSAMFKGEIATSSTYYAVYPYKEGMTMPSKTFTVEVPAVQPYVEKTFASNICPMAGRSDSESKIYFNNLCGVLVINLTGNEKIRSITFTGNDESGKPLKISGEHIVDMNYTDVPVLTPTSNSTSQVTVKCETPVELNESVPTPFHFVLPPAEYTSFTLIVCTENGTIMIQAGKKPLTIKRTNLTKAGALEFVEAVDVDLSEKGNANCYIVTNEGLYSFDASTIGTGKFGLISGAGFHTDNVTINPVSAELIWSSPESVVSNINFDPENNRISFCSSGIEGNALIAAKDAEGNVLWSWHIWVTDQPVEQHYVNDAGEFDVLDRNLGATRADRGTGDEWKESIGVYYQWGRKDPFISNHYKDIGRYQEVSILESILSPNSIVTNNYIQTQAGKKEWMYPTNTLLWNISQKTIYDPCPAGYVVANNAIWSGFISTTDDSTGSEVYNTSGQFDNGWNFFCNGSETAWYPRTGMIFPRYEDTIDDYHCYLWSSSHPYSLHVSEGEMNIMNSSFNSVVGCPVRCMKDNKTTSVLINWGKPYIVTKTSVTVFANVNVYGVADSIEKGFIYGTLPDINIENGIKIPCNNGAEGEFNTTISDLTPSTRYFVRPYAEVDGEIHYDSVRQITTTDVEGHIDLSTDGTSNSYIISTSGTYRFDCTVKGNGTESVGDPYTAIVIWETLNTKDAVSQGAVIASVSLEGNHVIFSTPKDFTPGNALIAVKSITGKILWSWHIWAVDFDPEGYAQIYRSGAMMMDRNLGALNNDVGDVRAFGLYYQWGRKDPFVGTGDTSFNEFAATSPADAITYVDRDSSTDLLDYATRYPQRVIKNSSWNDNNVYWTDIKTQYDPCPPGWRVPDRDVWTYFNSSDAYYPAAGNVHNAGFNSGTYYWTAHRRYYWNRSSTGNTIDVHNELPIRCMKDAVFTVATRTEADVVRDIYIKASGTLTVSDDTKMEAKGFICSSTASDPKLYTEGCIITDEGTAEGDFTSTIKGLLPGTTYYIRAYAKGGYNVRYGQVITVKTKEGADGEGYLEDDDIFEW